MATFSSPEALNRAIAAMERDLERRYKDMGTEMAQKARPEAYRAAAADLGGDPKFSGWRPWLELQVKPKPYGAAVIPTRYSAGPWTVAQFGRNQTAGPLVRQSSISIKTGRRKRAGRGRFRRWNGVTAGKGTADAAFDRMENATKDMPEKLSKAVIRRHFDVS